MATHSTVQDPFARDGRLWNAIYGCWMGKNCGGTLGAPLEKGFGSPDPFDVWWYPKLQEGGIPNDDLELQLLWLKALEEVGPALTASDLAEYWLDHVGYNWDEYGFAKTNLRLGLPPPVSGWFNNWFRDCMGCPIRSEIWACVAPGRPRIAARYAYEDAIVDHAGGEGLQGELFNVAVEAAAFVERDPLTLIDIGLSYVSARSQTATAIRAALAARAAGVDWLEARRRVLAATPHAVAQYVPINIAFQVIGWLWGDDFGDAICKAVNCGYDTDCTGATLGSYIGILVGRHGLPAKWVEPLGETIATNESWGGLKNASTGPNPIPTNLTDLTDRVCAVARRVLAHHGIFGNPTAGVRREDLYADAATRAILDRPAHVAPFELGPVQVDVEYVDGPAVRPGERKAVRTTLRNRRGSRLVAVATLGGEAATQAVDVPAHGSVSLDWAVEAPAELGATWRCGLRLDATNRPAIPSVPIVFAAAMKLRVCGPLPLVGDERATLDAAQPPEVLSGEPTEASSRPGEWQVRFAPENELPIGDLLAGGGVVYVQTFVFSPRAFRGKVAVPFSQPTKVWSNGVAVAEACRYRANRPSSDAGGDGQPVPAAEVDFRTGWNEILIKFVRRSDASVPFDAHLIVTEGKLADGLVDVVRSRFPWDQPLSLRATSGSQTG